jgi:hypothetical protein
MTQPELADLIEGGFRRSDVKEASLKFAILNPKNGFTVLISRVENQIDYHTYNSSRIKHLPNAGGLPPAIEGRKIVSKCKAISWPAKSDFERCRERNVDRLRLQTTQPGGTADV